MAVIKLCRLLSPWTKMADKRSICSVLQMLMLRWLGRCLLILMRTLKTTTTLTFVSWWFSLTRHLVLFLRTILAYELENSVDTCQNSKISCPSSESASPKSRCLKLLLNYLSLVVCMYQSCIAVRNVYNVVLIYVMFALHKLQHLTIFQRSLPD